MSDRDWHYIKADARYQGTCAGCGRQINSILEVVWRDGKSTDHYCDKCKGGIG